MQVWGLFHTPQRVLYLKINMQRANTIGSRDQSHKRFASAFGKKLSRLRRLKSRSRTIKSIRSLFDIELKRVTLGCVHTASRGDRCVTHTDRSSCCNLRCASISFPCVQISLVNQLAHSINKVCYFSWLSPPYCFI